MLIFISRSFLLFAGILVAQSFGLGENLAMAVPPDPVSIEADSSSSAQGTTSLRCHWQTFGTGPKHLHFTIWEIDTLGNTIGPPVNEFDKPVPTPVSGSFRFTFATDSGHRYRVEAEMIKIKAGQPPQVTGAAIPYQFYAD